MIPKTTSRTQQPAIAVFSALVRAIAVLGTALILLAGCLPAGTDYSLGFYTSAIEGRFEMERLDLALGGPLVIAIKHHHLFSDSRAGGSAQTRPSAHVIPVNAAGRFSVAMPADVSSIDLMLIVPDHLSRQYTFSRSLGVGDISVDPRLQPLPGWRSHFYTFIEPQVQHYIVETRYGLSNAEQGMLAEWLRIQQSRLETPRDASGAAKRIRPEA